MGGGDNLLGWEGKDWVFGGDEERPRGGDKNSVGGPGNDGVLGGEGSDNLLGASGNDLVNGDNGSDSLLGGGGKDVLDGGRGSDRVVGGEGDDLLTDGPFRATSKDEALGGGDAIIVDNKPTTRDLVACGKGFDRVAADAKDVVAPDCERVATGPDAVEELDQELVEEGLLDGFEEGLAPFSGG